MGIAFACFLIIVQVQVKIVAAAFCCRLFTTSVAREIKKNVCSLKFISFLVRFTSVLSFHVYVAIKILASYKNDIIGLRNARKKENLQFM